MDTSHACRVFQRTPWPAELPGAQRGLSHCVSIGQNPTGIDRSTIQGWLIGLNGIHRGEDFRLGHGDSIVGSAMNADIVITAPGTSARHAIVTCQGATPSVRRLSDRGVLLVNGEAVVESALSDGDEIALGEARFLFRLAARFHEGYMPTSRAIVRAAPGNASSLPHFTCGWLVALNGPHAGQDFRLISGVNRVGTRGDLEISLLDDSDRVGDAVWGSIVWTGAGLRLEPAAPDSPIHHQGSPVTSPVSLRDSETIRWGPREYYVKCL